jgi:ADP-heptose:LPS heptosyltransferase
MRLDNIGDVIMTSPALRSLRENLPNAKITLMASPSGALVAPLLPWIDEVLPWQVLWQDLGRLDFEPEREWRLIETLKARQFDAAIFFTSFSQSPHPPGLICALAGICLRLGESKEHDVGTLTHAIPPASDQLHQADRNLRLIESMGFRVCDRRLSLHVPIEAQHSANALLSRHFQTLFSGLALHTVDQWGTPSSASLLISPPASRLDYFLLNPWTTCQSRNYDAARFAIAARELSQMTNFPVVVTGVVKDCNRASVVLDILGDRAIDLVGKTSLSELVALVAGAKLVLTNNTSTMHMADAMNTPSVILFAGTELICQWQPRYAPVRILNRPTVCSPCYAFTCPHELQCLDITPQQVVEAGLELLSQS